MPTPMARPIATRRSETRMLGTSTPVLSEVVKACQTCSGDASVEDVIQPSHDAACHSATSSSGAAARRARPGRRLVMGRVERRGRGRAATAPEESA
jgi:hypothetical protein